MEQQDNGTMIICQTCAYGTSAANLPGLVYCTKHESIRPLDDGCDDWRPRGSVDHAERDGGRNVQD